MSPRIQSIVENMAHTFAQTLSGEELYDTELLPEVYDNAVDYFNSYYNELEFLNFSISQYAENMKKIDPNNVAHVEGLDSSRKAIEALIESIEKTYGVDLPLLDVLLGIRTEADKTGTGVSELEKQLESLYDTLSEDVLKKQIDARSEAGWDTEIAQIEKLLKEGDIAGITKMVEDLSAKENLPWLEQMKQDLPFLSEFLKTFFDDSGALVPDPTNIADAY